MQSFRRGFPGATGFHAVLAQSQRLAEAADRIEDVDAGAVRDALIDEEPMAILRTAAVVTDPSRGRDEGRQQVGARCDLHLQQGVEALRRAQALPEFATQRAHAGQSGLLVVFDEVHAGQAFEQPMLAATDDPAQAQVRPGRLQGAHQRDDMGYIAQRGQPQQAGG